MRGKGEKGSSLACVHPTRMIVVSQHRAGEDVKKPAPQDTQTRSRLLIGQNGPSDSALAASSGWRLLAAQPLTGTLRAALLGACARACVPRRYTPSVVDRADQVPPIVERGGAPGQGAAPAGKDSQAFAAGGVKPCNIGGVDYPVPLRAAANLFALHGGAGQDAALDTDHTTLNIGLDDLRHRGRIASRAARPSTGPEKRSAQRAGQRLRGEQSPAAGGRQRGVRGAVLAYKQAR